MLTLTLRGILAHKLRLLLTALAVMLGVAFMAGTLVLTDTMQASLRPASSATRTRHRRGRAGDHVTIASVRHQRGADAATSPPRWRPSTAWPRRHRGSRAFAQVLGGDGKPVDDLSGDAAVPAAAARTSELNPFELVAGRAPRGADEVVVDRSTADVGDLSIGDRTSVLDRRGPAGHDRRRHRHVRRPGQPGRRRTVLFDTADGRAAPGRGRPGRRHRACWPTTG